MQSSEWTKNYNENKSSFGNENSEKWKWMLKESKVNFFEKLQTNQMHKEHL